MNDYIMECIHCKVVSEYAVCNSCKIIKWYNQVIESKCLIETSL